jgi:hypothetical protein
MGVYCQAERRVVAVNAKNSKHLIPCPLSNRIHYVMSRDNLVGEGEIK